MLSKLILWSWPLLLWACDTAGTGRSPDAGPAELDAVTQLDDALDSTVDAGPLTPDAGPPTPDAGPPTPDAGPPTPDAGPPIPDAAPSIPDAAPPIPDAAPPIPDAAPPIPDAAPPIPDAAPPPALLPLINEIVASNSGGLLDEDGDSSDWIEIYNPHPVALELAGYHLSDDADALDAWTFPAATLPAKGYLVVFASGKDRGGPELHTNFSLRQAGEFLALSGPDGELEQRFDPYPPQVEGVAFGSVATVETQVFIDSASRGLVSAPFNDPVGSWRGVNDPPWPEVSGGVGFDQSTFAGRVFSEGLGPDEWGPKVADSVEDWSADGRQGAAGWTYGYFDATNDGDGVFAVDEFTAFPRSGAAYGPDDYWNGSQWDWFRGNPPWTQIGQRAVHSNGTNNAVEHWAIRRWVSPVAGPLLVSWTVAKSNPNGRGVTGKLFHQGAELDSVTIAGDDRAGVERAILIEGVRVGDAIDLVHTPEGLNGDRRDSSDGSLMTMQIFAAPSIAQAIDSDVAEVAAQGAGGLFLRYPFEVEEAADFDAIVLTAQYDDGFVAWLDNAEIGSANAPDGARFDSYASRDRTPAEALAPEELVLPRREIEAGAHVLAVHLLDAEADDGQLLFSGRLEGRRIFVDDGPPVYLRRPTPGAPNVQPRAELPPLIGALSRDLRVQPGEAAVVLATVFETVAPIESVTLHYRRRFEEVLEAPMAELDAGQWVFELPAAWSTPGELLRWYVIATDVDGREARWPPFEAPLDSEAYYGAVVQPQIESPLPVLHWFIEAPGAANSNQGTRAVIAFDDEVYDNIKVDLHGQSSRGFPKKSYDIDLNRDHRFKLRPGLPRMKDINLLNNYADKAKLRNTVSYEIYAATGGAYHLAQPIRVEQNGAFFAIYELVEDGDDRWIERLGYAPIGALYKMYGRMDDASRGEKKTRRGEGTQDLQALVEGVALEPEARRRFLYDAINLPAMANFLAGMFLTADMDCCHKNYYAYRDSEGTGEWWYLPWDVDLTLGRNWTGNYFDDRMYPQNPMFIGRNNRLLTALYADPGFDQMYRRRLRTLVDALVQPPETPEEELWLEGRVDYWHERLAADALLDNAAWPTWGIPQTLDEAVTIMRRDFLAARRLWIYTTLVAPEVDVEPPTVLVPRDAEVRWRVPVDDALGLGWTALDFDPDLPGGDTPAWGQGPMGLGYEDDAPGSYAGFLRTRIKPSEAAPEAVAIQLRAVFELADPASVETLVLSARYDDGFIAYLNGVEVLRRNHPAEPGWAIGGQDHADGEAAIFERVALEGAADRLVAGQNVLAIHAANIRPGSSDMAIQVELTDGLPAAEAGIGALPPAQDEAVRVAIGAAQIAEAAAESYVVLSNPLDVAVDLSGLRLLGGGVRHRFEPGTVIPAGGLLYVVADAIAFRARVEGPSGGQGLLVQGNWDGTLQRVGAVVVYDDRDRVRSYRD